MAVKDSSAEKVATISMLVLLLLFLAPLMLVRCQPDSTEKDIEIDCTWKGAPVSANLKWTETKENTAATTKTDSSGSKSSQSGTTTNAQAKTATNNTQQALIITGVAAGGALVGAGALMKKLEGSNPSGQETKQTTSTSATTPSSQTGTSSTSTRSGSDVLMQHPDELKSSTQSQSSTQTQQSKQSQPNVQDPPKGNGSTSSLPVIAPATAGQLWMQQQMNSQSSKQSEKSSTQVGTTQSTKQATSSTSTTSKNLGLMASSPSSAAQIANEMWPQKQKELEQLAKQRSDLAATFSTPSYSTGMSIVSSLTTATENTWARLQGFSSAISNGIDRVVEAVKPYTPYILMAACIALILITSGLAAPAEVAVGGVGLSQGAGLVGGGVTVGYGIYQLQYQIHNLGIMNYPKQPSFVSKHTQYIQQSTSEIKNEKGSGTYGVDPAKEQLDQADIRKDSVIETGGLAHQRAEKQAKEWLKKQGEKEINGPIWHEGSRSYYREQPDLTSENYLVECKTGRERSTDEIAHFWDQANEYPIIAEKEGRKLVIWLDEVPPKGNEDYWSIINWLRFKGAKVLAGPDGENVFGDG